MSYDELLARSDIRYFPLYYDVCPYCSLDFRTMHPLANLYPHWTGACRETGKEETQ